jgi:hypothetical protein
MGPPSGPGWSPSRVTNEGSRKLLIAVVSVLAVAAAGFAVVNLRGGGGAGASSPEAALDQFFGAVADEDVIGVLEEMAPAERDAMVSWFRGLESNLSDLGVIEDVDLNGVGGADLEIEDLESRVEEVMPGVSRVYVTGGELSVATEPESVPVGEVLEDLIEANGGEVDIDRVSDELDFDDLADEAEDSGDEPLFLVATEQDGRWYLSLSYTIAEYARLDAGVDPPDPGEAVEPQGAASAEEAAREFLTATADLDVERMISLLPPDEMGALQAYAPLFLEDAEEAVEEMRVEDGFEASVEGLEFDTRDVEGGTRVVPRAGTLEITTDDGDLSVSLDEGCIEATGEIGDDFDDEYGTSVVCMDDLQDDLQGDLTEEERADLEEVGRMFSDYQPGMVVVEEDGRHYVSPLRTFSDLTLQVFDGIERADLEEGGILYRIFTGDSVLLSGEDEDFDSGFDDDFDDELDEDDLDEDDLDDDVTEEELPDGDLPPAVPDDVGLGPDYDAAYQVGYPEGMVDGTVDGTAGDYFASFDDTLPQIPPDVEDPTAYELGYQDGYFDAYEEAYYEYCDPATTGC